MRFSVFFILIIFFCSCRFQKQYKKQNFSFYSSDFSLDASSPLRTDGVYLFEGTDTVIPGTTSRTTSRVRALYKFYQTGQVNKILDTGCVLTHEKEFIDAFNAFITSRQNGNTPTLFESYYRLKDNKLAIQGVVSSTGKFYYTYALVEKDRIVIVKSTHIGRGEIADRHFSGQYMESYRFIPTENRYLDPYW